MSIIFFGSSEFSLAALETCLEGPYSVSLVVTTPDKKKGRGLELLPTPVKSYCQSRNIPVETFESLKDPAALEKIKSLNPDFFVVSSYGKLIPSAWLAVPKKLCLNVHPSLLPKYRGAAPINWPIINGDKETGMTIAEVTKQLDAGDIFFQQRIPVDPHIDAEALTQKLAEISKGALKSVFQKIKEGNLVRTPQQENLSSYARKLTKEDGKLSFHQPAVNLDRLVRGLKPWPGTFIDFEGGPLQIIEAEAVAHPMKAEPGSLIKIDCDGTILVITADGFLKIKRVKPAGKKEMTAADFVRGKRLEPGFIFKS